MIVDGRAIAEQLCAALEMRRNSMSGPLTLGIVVSLSGQGGADPVIESFVAIKAQIAARLSVNIERVDVPPNATLADAQSAIEELASRTDAVIVQLPLSGGLDTDAVLSAIPKEKDVDAINPNIADSDRPVRAPVACAVVELLNHAKVEIAEKRIVVIGAGRLVGAPTALLLKSLGGIVSTVTLETGSMGQLKDADIIVCGAGRPGLVRPEHIQDGVVIIDAGTSEQGGVVRGDADPACAQKASLMTPVPGGVGPVAVAMIFRNLLDLVEKSRD